MNERRINRSKSYKYVCSAHIKTNKINQSWTFNATWAVVLEEDREEKKIRTMKQIQTEVSTARQSTTRWVLTFSGKRSQYPNDGNEWKYHKTTQRYKMVNWKIETRTKKKNPEPFPVFCYILWSWEWLKQMKPQKKKTDEWWIEYSPFTNFGFLICFVFVFHSLLLDGVAHRNVDVGNVMASVSRFRWIDKNEISN